jgi:hypothetical protein
MTPLRPALAKLGTFGALGSVVAAPVVFGVCVARLGPLYPQTALAWLLPLAGGVLVLAPLLVVGRELRRRPVR